LKNSSLCVLCASVVKLFDAFLRTLDNESIKETPHEKKTIPCF
jgi:hypothetical protein